jgi:predicted Zn-dependent protease
MSLVKRLSTILLLSSFISSNALATAPIDLPDFGTSAGASLTLTQELALGNLYMQQMRASGIIYYDPYLNDYLNSISKRLLSAIPPTGRQFTFFLVNNPHINAFALPGGYIGVHTGLLTAAHSESEVASVLSHEIAHVTQRHIARFFERGSQMTWPALAALLGSAILATANPSAGMGAMAATMGAAQQSAINFQQQQEKEADRIGIDTLRRADYDPHAMAAFFERLLENERYNGSRMPEFLRSHPLTSSRVADAKHRDKVVKSVPAQDPRPFRLAQTRISVMQSRETQRTLHHYQEALKTSQYNDEAVTRYGYALALYRSDNLNAAQEQAQLLLKSYPKELPFWLLMAEIQTQQDKFAGANETLMQALQEFPNNRALRTKLAEVHLQTSHPEDARKILRKLVRENPDDMQAIELLAQANANAGRKAESHVVRADELLLIGDLQGAIQQLEIAKKDAKSEFVKESVNAKLERLKEALAEKSKWF